MVTYTYDAWGKVLSVTGTAASTVGAANPLRYRGYVYDTETGLYYLNSRYYDPGVGKFINADAIVTNEQGPLEVNIFIYWNTFRFNPALETKKFTLDSKASADGYREFLMNEARYSRLTREFPERAEGLFELNEAAAKERYEHLVKLQDLYAD